MKLKMIKDEDFVNYKKASMFIGTTTCNFKCCKEAGIPASVCQNYSWNNNRIINYYNDILIRRYMENPITEAICFGGLEPLDQWDELYELISMFREKTDDDIVIYTGYNKNEILKEIRELKEFKNIIIKYGRYVPNDESRFDEVLGVTLASKNQYAEKIS